MFYVNAGKSHEYISPDNFIAFDNLESAKASVLTGHENFALIYKNDTRPLGGEPIDRRKVVLVYDDAHGWRAPNPRALSMFDLFKVWDDPL